MKEPCPQYGYMEVAVGDRVDHFDLSGRVHHDVPHSNCPYCTSRQEISMAEQEDPQPPFTDWYERGCHRSCRFEHTHTPGGCDLASAAGTVRDLSVWRPGVGVDDEPVISTQTYSFRDLTDLIGAALREVDITLGPNSLKLLEDGVRMKLTDGEYDAMAMTAATVLIEGKGK